MLRLFVTTLLFCLVTPLAAANIETGDPALDAAFVQIQDRDFTVKVQGVNALAASGHAKSGALLRGLLEGELRYVKKLKRLVWMQKEDGKYSAVDVFSDEKLGNFSKRKFKKLAINNAMRGQIRGLLAELELSDPDPAVRRTAVAEMIGNIDADSAARLGILRRRATHGRT